MVTESIFVLYRKTGETVLSSVLISKSTGYPGIVIAEPIKDENQQLIGVLIANVELRGNYKQDYSYQGWRNRLCLSG